MEVSTIKAWVDIASIIVSIFTTLSIISGAFLYFINNRRDRRIKTLEYWEETQPNLIEARTLLININNTGLWTEELAKKQLNNKNNKPKIYDALSKFERLAIGINLNTYDIKVLNKLSGNFLIDSYLAYIPLIECYQSINNEPGSFCEFRKLYETLTKIQNH